MLGMIARANKVVNKALSNLLKDFLTFEIEKHLHILALHVIPFWLNMSENIFSSVHVLDNPYDSCIISLCPLIPRNMMVPIIVIIPHKG